VLVVPYQSEDVQAHVGSRLDPLEHGRDRLAVADDHRATEVVAAAAREAQGLAEGGAGEPDQTDREQPEVHDDDAGILVPLEEEGHHRHQHESTHGGGLGDVGRLREMRSNASRPVEIERAERHPPDEQDRDQHEQVRAERWNLAARDRRHDHVEANAVSEQPAARHQQQVGHEHELLEQARVGLQHPPCSASFAVR
jgi:hypothetical protein